MWDYPEAIGTLTEALPAPENRQIGLLGDAVRRYHGAVRPGTVPGHGPNGKSRSIVLVLRGVRLYAVLGDGREIDERDANRLDTANKAVAVCFEFG